jgi:hypothetical protein
VSKLYMLAGGIVEPGAGRPGTVSAFVAYNPKPGVSRLFKVRGPTSGPEVIELPSMTTIDLAGFRSELAAELEPALAEIAGRGGTGAIATPKAEWVTGMVERHLAAKGNK